MKTQPRLFLRLAAVGLLMASFTFTQAQSELVFQDNFNLGVGTTDINEGLASRQSGTAGVVSYLESSVTGSEGGLPGFTEIYEDRLYIWVNFTTEAQSSTWVSPNRNFVDGPTFTLEFKLDPSVLDEGRASDDWAAVVFGATATGQFVNSSDGMGLLFRSNGAIQFFDGGTAVYGSEPATIPAGEVQVRIEVTGEGFTGTTPATVALFVDNDPVSLTAENATYTRATGFRANYLTLLGYATQGNEWQYTFDDLTVRADTCVRLDPQEIILDAEPTGPIQIALKVPPTFNNSQGGTVTLSSSNPGVVSIVGAQDNQLAVNFTAGGPTSQIINLEVVGSGRARIFMATAAPDCMGDPAVIMTPMVTTVLNPSFENNYNPAYPHYSAIADWTGGSGVNRSAGPFHNGTIPDRAQIAFLQGANTISQLLTDLEPGKNYWLQVRYNARNCCGDFPDMTVSIDGTALGTESAIQAADTYYFRNFEFTPTMDTALLEISGKPNAGGDATLLIDAVAVVQRDAGNVVIQNPSFEASGIVPLPGTFSGQNLSGWQGEGTFGLNLSGDSFADNGITPEGSLVAFVQGVGSLSQTLNGLIPNETYTVSFAYNARSGNQPHLLVTADAAVLLDVDVDPVGSNPYHQASVTFTAQTGSAVLRFAQTAEGDQTVLFDDIRVVGAAINLPCIQLSPDQVQLSVGQTSSEVTVKVLEDVVANGPTTVSVTSTDPAVASLPGAVNGTLTLTFQLGGELVQTVQVVGAAPGSARLLFSEPRGVCFDKTGINVLVLRGFVRNPSFEANSHSAWPGYGPIASWSSEGGGNTGINDATGPFHDNGVIPDRNQVALLQTLKIIRQDIVNLTPSSRYWLQFYYN
ncbi:MAG: DUF642 domain-containing protein, partial [Verrucomicrobia bacterium]|nr:DUF642 domain-containing protein [Verrucomicrobiota bacterium]